VSDTIKERMKAALAVCAAVAEQFAVLWLLRAVDMSSRPYPPANDLASRIGPGTLMLYTLIGLNFIFACWLYDFSQRVLPSASERLVWSAVPMTIWPWTTGLLLFLPLPASIPWQLKTLVGSIAPYAIAAAILHELEREET
jgi:hypothetical protein